MILWTLLGISWLVNHVGRLIFYDTSTERMNGFRYAKALVKVSPDYELPDSIDVDGLGENYPLMKISYDWRPNVTTQNFRHLKCKLIQNLSFK